MEYSQNMDTPYTLRRGSKLQSLVLSRVALAAAPSLNTAHLPLPLAPLVVDVLPLLKVSLHLFPPAPRRRYIQARKILRRGIRND
jgi:hypothetical protein